MKPFDDVHCRRAVAWAVDQAGQRDARGGPLAGGDVATTMIPPPVKYHRAFDLFPTPGGRGDLAKAKAELAACGLPNGFETKMACRNTGKESAQAEAVQASLAKIGVKVTIDQHEPSQYLSAQLGIPANMRAKGYGLALAAFGPDWPAPYALLRPTVDGRTILPQGNSNYASLDDPAVNAAIDAGAAATDDGAAQQAWTKADQAVVRSAAYVPLVYDKALNIFSERLTNIYFTPAYLMTDFASLGVVHDRMTRFVLVRAARGTVTLWLVSVVTFGLFFLVPKVLGSNPAVLFAGRSPDAATVAAVTEKLGLDRPCRPSIGILSAASSPAGISTPGRTPPGARRPAWDTRSRTTCRSGRRWSTRCRSPFPSPPEPPSWPSAQGSASGSSRRCTPGAASTGSRPRRRWPAPRSRSISPVW